MAEYLERNKIPFNRIKAVLIASKINIYVYNVILKLLVLELFIENKKAQTISLIYV